MKYKWNLLPLAILSLMMTQTVSSRVGENFDHRHASFSNILRTFVEEGKVNYAGLLKSPYALAGYLAKLAAVSRSDYEGWNRDQQLAFLINLYNAATLGLIVDHYPIKSIRKIGFFPLAAWKKTIVRVFGKKISLKELENTWIREGFEVPEIHFALVCASIGCPVLRKEAYTGNNLKQQLFEQGEAFMADVSKNRIAVDKKNTIYLSKIFDWYQEDFGENKTEVINYVMQFYSDDQKRRLVPSEGEIKVIYTDYDWNLNSQ
jgi:hypothetical protein